TLVLFNIFFIIGLKTVKSAKVSLRTVSRQNKTILIFLLFTVGTIGVLIKAYQRFFVEKIYFAENLVRTRMDLMAGELNSGLMGVFSALTYPFATIVLMLSILWYKDIRRISFVFILIVGLFPIYDAILTESRLLIV